MFFQKNLEDKLTDQDKKIEELCIRMDGLSRHVDELMEQLDVTPEQISTYVSDPANFHPEEWETLQKETKKLDEKLILEQASITNPLSTKKKMAERNIPPNWLFVR